jgi:transposase
LIGVARVLDGWGPQEVAELLGVNVSSVCRWVERFSRGGWAGPCPTPVSGRPPELTERRADRVLSWVRERRPQDLGFAADSGSHWTARRVAAVVERRFGARFNPRYLNDWLSRHGISPQLPQRVPRERDQAAIARWLARDWPAIKRGRRWRARPSFSRTKPAF